MQKQFLNNISSKLHSFHFWPSTAFSISVSFSSFSQDPHRGDNCYSSCRALYNTQLSCIYSLNAVCSLKCNTFYNRIHIQTWTQVSIKFILYFHAFFLQHHCSKYVLITGSMGGGRASSGLVCVCAAKGGPISFAGLSGEIGDFCVRTRVPQPLWAARITNVYRAFIQGISDWLHSANELTQCSYVVHCSCCSQTQQTSLFYHWSGWSN